MSLPIYYHPSLTVLVDDSPSFLQSLAFQLDTSLPRKAFHDAQAALEWIRQRCLDARQPQRVFPQRVDTYPGSPQQHAIAFELDQIHQISFHSHRFMTPSVLIVDYSMPQMNGIQFCEALHGLPLKIILLTGIADENIAVAAFNRGLIHRYIRKSDDDALERLGTDILALQQNYFMAQSESMAAFLALCDYDFVTDPAIAKLLQEINQQYQTVEYYLFPRPAGILLYDMDARARLLIVETEQSMDAHYEMARDNDAPISLMTALEERRIIPNFGDGDGMYSPAFGKDWYKYCKPAQLCQGRKAYYWAVFDIEPGAPEGPTSFRTFMHDHLRNP